jgi:hypothetical protein
LKTLLCSSRLGDSIILVGAAVALAKRHGGLRYLCLRQYEESIRSFFVGTDVVVEANSDDLCLDDRDCIKAGGFALEDIPPMPEKESWAEWLYRGLGVDYKERWDLCPLREAAKHVKQAKWPDAAFLHDDASRGFKIDKFPRYPAAFQRVTDEGGSILQYVNAIENAPEVHCIDSCFWHLSESLKPKGELYLHRYARYWRQVWHDVPVRNSWMFVDDEHVSASHKIYKLLGGLWLPEDVSVALAWMR